MRPVRNLKAAATTFQGLWRLMDPLCGAALRLAGRLHRCDISFFHQFEPPPTGGGHQFLRALWRELQRRGYRLENNRISKTTRACLFNSFNFDFRRLQNLQRAGCRMIHRVDGPIGVYRGYEDGTDERIWRINAQLADATVFQSRFSLRCHRKLGYDFKAPAVIMNAADPAIFFPARRNAWPVERKIRLVSTSWSDNPNKGASTYRWLDRNLDWQRFEYTFIGRVTAEFKHIRAVGPAVSAAVAEHLRHSDIYITASRNDPCSNSLIEALSCGLPAIYLDSGGHPEIVGEAGFGFLTADEIPGLLQRLAEQYAVRRKLIRLPDIAQTAERYLDLMLSGTRATPEPSMPGGLGGDCSKLR